MCDDSVGDVAGSDGGSSDAIGTGGILVASDLVQIEQRHSDPAYLNRISSNPLQGKSSVARDGVPNNDAKFTSVCVVRFTCAACLDKGQRLDKQMSDSAVWLTNQNLILGTALGDILGM